MRKALFFSLAACLSLLITGCIKKTSGEGDYPIQPVPFTSVKLTDNFWAPKIRINEEVTIPIAFGYCESTGRVKNFEIAGGLAEGDSFLGDYPFNDSDVYKIIEGAAYSLQTFPDAKLEAYVDTLIYKISMAQEDDGYLYTNRTINGDENVHPWGRGGRWVGTHDLSHELYNLGHLYEAAVAYFQATGKRELLDVALKSADLVDRDFGWEMTDKYVNYPGHQVIEMGLVKLYRVTGEKRYLDLAKFFLDVRGDGPEYCQAHMPVTEQAEAVGHSVRATYMYSGMADVAAMYNDRSYVDAISKIWEDIVWTKLYVTGGIGASGGNEGFGEHYHLPNMSAYCETCASIGNIFTNHRLFLMHGQGKYYDVLERTLFNAMLSGVSLTGDHFFYPNPLESYGQHQRSEWFGCACCPSNVSRFLPAVPGYLYATAPGEIFVNLFAASEAELFAGGKKVEIVQETNYPWDGKLKLKVNPEEETRFKLKIRIPGWARGEALPGQLYKFTDNSADDIKIALNGEQINYKMKNGYAVISREWQANDIINLELPMEIRQIEARYEVEADHGRVAIQRGPMVYCAEWADNNEGHTRNLLLDPAAQMRSEFVPDLLNGTQVIHTEAQQTALDTQGELTIGEKEELMLIPYHLWANRGPGDMLVWIPVDTANVSPKPAPTIAYRSTISASHETRALQSICDQYEPANSNDHSYPYYHWWPKKNSWEYIQYDFEKSETVSSSEVYWFDDGPAGGCRVPDDWELLYKHNNKWVKIEPAEGYPVNKDSWDKIEFEPITTDALRLRVKLQENFASGVHEWKVK